MKSDSASISSKSIPQHHFRTIRIISLITIAVGLAMLGSSASARFAARKFVSKAVAAVRESAMPKPAPRASGGNTSVPISRLNKRLLPPLNSWLPIQTNEASVSTDKLHYEPGETVLISGAGFRPNEKVTLQIRHHDLRVEVGAAYDPWDVTADGAGKISSSWIVDPNEPHGSWLEVRAKGAESGLFAMVFFTDPASADLDQCGNGKPSAPVPCTLDAWQNGNLNHNQAHYSEGDSVPYRMKLDQLVIGASNTLTISYDTTKSGKHALDYLTDYDRTESVGNNPCSGVAGCLLASETTFPIPLDPRVANGQNQVPGGDDITQIPGSFSLFGGTITAVSGYTVSGSYAGDSTTFITITFTSDVTNPVMAWGGHIGTRLDWGIANSAIAIPGSPYHMRLEDINGGGGNQDRSLSASAVFFPISVTIVKETNPDDAQSKTFNYTTTGTDLSAFSLTPPNGLTSDSKNFVLTDDSTRTVTESDPHAAPPEFTLTNIACVQVDGGLGVGTFDINLAGRSVSFSPDEGQSITCTFTNAEDLNATRGRIIVDKVTDPSGDPTSFDFTSTYGSPFSLTDAAAPNNSGLITPGTYSVSETVPSGWDLTTSCTSSIGDMETIGSIELDAGETVTCTFTNTKRGHIIVDKVTNPSGDPQSFSFDAGGTGYVDFNLTDAAAPNDQTLAPGSYSVSETEPSGWNLTNTSCTSSIGDTETAESIELDAGETVTCTFTNTKRGHIIIDKVTNPSGDPQSFAFDAGGTGYVDFNLTDAAAPNDQTLAPGSYSVSETVPSGWDLTNTSCTSSIDDTETAASIELDAGETVTCTFTNTKRGHIIVDKVTNPSGDPQSFAFDAGGTGYVDFNLTDAAAPNNQELAPGSYSVSETVPGGWDLTNTSCTSSIDDTETAASIELDAGETVTCTFTNTKRGHIIVDKVTNPSGDPQSFAFDAGGTGYVDFNLTDAAAPNDQELTPGSYSVSETVPGGWDLTDTSCVSSIDDTETAASIELDAGETVTCTFTNTKRGHIIVDKVTDPSGDPQSFAFDAGGTGYVDFNLTDAAAPNDQTLAPGSYSVSETVPSGWDLTNTSCTSSIDDAETAESIELDAGETVTCTFTNTKRGHIIVDKVTNPSGDPQSFAFDAGGTGYVDFNLTDAAAPNNQELTPGSYSVSETVPSGWNLTNSSCVSSIDDTESPGAIELDAGETVTCTFTNTKRGHIIVDKVTNPSGDPQSFAFDAGGTGYVDFNLTDAAAPNNQELAPGGYSVSETVPNGWDLTNTSCTSSIADMETAASIELDAGETVTCTFYNRKRARLIVEKQTNPDGATGSFTFTGTAAGTISDGGNLPVGNLVPGIYMSAENNPAPNFDLTSIVCNDVNSTGDTTTRTATFRLEPGETVKCTFTNTQRGMAEIDKTVSGQPPAAGQTFTFEIRQGASTVSDGTVLESKTTDASGNLSFTTKLVAGQTYQICEWVFPGWNTNLVGDGPLFVPNSMIPPALPNPNVNNLTVCTSFTVQPGQTRTFTVDNSPPPGGRALTIGFWKNWASCASSNGKGQKNMLDLALGKASATTTNPPGGLVGSAQNPGALWPNYAAYWYLILKGDPTSTELNIKPAAGCAGAVALLDKRSIDGKKKMASDPLFNMTAQLIGAQLNRFMGAGVNGTTIMNIDRAVLLNGKYKFNGNTYSPKLSNADAKLANCLATQLDNYNNGNPVSLCP